MQILIAEWLWVSLWVSGILIILINFKCPARFPFFIWGHHFQTKWHHKGLKDVIFFKVSLILIKNSDFHHHKLNLGRSAYYLFGCSIGGWPTWSILLGRPPVSLYGSLKSLSPVWLGTNVIVANGKQRGELPALYGKLSGVVFLPISVGCRCFRKRLSSVFGVMSLVTSTPWKAPLRSCDKFPAYCLNQNIESWHICVDKQSIFQAWWVHMHVKSDSIFPVMSPAFSKNTVYGLRN